MHLFRSTALLAVLATFALLTVGSPSEADAARGGVVKFWSSEFQVNQTFIKPDGTASPTPLFSLQIVGRASAYGGEKVEFDFTVPDASAWMPLLQVCSGASARLSGTTAAEARIDEADRKIVGSGPLAELNCRHVLK